MSSDPWKILNLKPTRNKQLIEQTWRRLASKYHPDRGGDAEQFKLIRAAYEQALVKSKTVIEITTPKITLPINLSMGCSEVLRSEYVDIAFEHHEEKLQCSALIPEWEAEWGRQKCILVNTNNVNLMVNITLVDDELIWKDKLIWQPTIDLMPVLESRMITAKWNQQLVNIPVDCYGHGVLTSQGYKINEDTRLDIIVQPKYIWPKTT